METNHLLSYYIVAVGDHFYEKFEREQQEVVIQAIKESAVYQNELMEEYENSYKKILNEHHVEFIPVDREAFEKIALEKIAPALSERLSPGIIKRITAVK